MKKLLMITAAAAALSAQANPRLIPFKSDTQTGISTNKVYTHAYNRGTGSGTLVINDVVFTNSSAGSSSGIKYGWRGFPSASASSDSNISTPSGQKIRQLLNSLNYDIAHGTMYITGLDEGVCYEIRYYNRAWDNGGNRSQRFTFKPDNATADVIEFNPDASPVTDQMLAYRYIAPASGELAVQFDQLGGGTYHVYGFSNEEVWDIETHSASFAGDTFATLNGTLISNGKATDITAQWKENDGDDSELAWQGQGVATAQVGTLLSRSK